VGGRSDTRRHDQPCAHQIKPTRRRSAGRLNGHELGGRLLLRYVDVYAVHEPAQGRLGQPTWVTPTPFSPEEVDHYLDLPAPEKPRTHVVRLDPLQIAVIQGPQWVGLGMGIQYLLPEGYAVSAVLGPAWAHEVR
jgi:hypothetical protein